MKQEERKSCGGARKQEPEWRKSGDKTTEGGGCLHANTQCFSSVWLPTSTFQCLAEDRKKQHNYVLILITDPAIYILVYLIMCQLFI